jgi:hypothetical protein
MIDVLMEDGTEKSLPLSSEEDRRGPMTLLMMLEHAA